MTAEAYIFLAAALLGWAFVVVLSLGDVNLAERLRAATRRNEAQRREFGRKIRSLTRREAMLLDDLDFACAEAVALREQLDQSEANVETLGHLVLAIDEGSAS